MPRKAAAPLVLAFVWLLVSPACSTTATAFAPQPESVTWEWMEGRLGVAHWDCTEEYPTAWVRVYFRGLPLAWIEEGELWATPGFRETVAHELAHIAQIAQESSCADWKAALSDPAFRERIEEEATCLGVALGRGLPCKVP